ncbi:hypothetical protein [Flavobacterium psychrophilum]|uniref:hypothetical protein n=1 Tax=Flavobacterium psychrophilum TaxID=96345 RepID=UPI00106A28D2|nr:hypothetical protein [Flavobacterium psychrophilum]
MIETYGRTGIVANESTGFTFELSSNPREFDSFKVNKEDINHQGNYFTVGEWRILPYGTNDNLPSVIKAAVQENSTAPGMLEKKVMMYLGNGLFLYKEDIVDNNIVRVWTKDVAIQSWLNTWKCEEYINKCAVDYEYMKGHMTKLFRNKAGRTGGTNQIAKLEHIQLQEGRLACHISSTDLTPTHIVVTDYSFSTLEAITGIKVYPIFDVNNPFISPTSASYNSQYTFGDKHYSTPPLFGSLEWLRRSTATPIIFKALSKNSINVKYHVESPQEFWDREEKRLKDNAEKSGREYNDNEIIEYRKIFMRDLLKVLSGDENSGKLWHTRNIIEVQGQNIISHGWKITAIPQNIKDFVEAQIKISERADRALSANLGMGQGISNTGEAGKANGGSEQVYAYQNFMNSSVDIPERVICQTLNDAIKANFPNTDLKIGFHRNQAQTLSNINPADRPVNQKTE